MGSTEVAASWDASVVAVGTGASSVGLGSRVVSTGVSLVADVSIEIGAIVETSSGFIVFDSNPC